MDKKNTIDRLPKATIFHRCHLFSLLMCFCVHSLGLGFENLFGTFVCWIRIRLTYDGC